MPNLTIDLQYITPDQARQVIGMFDGPEQYRKNFSALKAITRGLFKLLCEGGNPKIQGMFNTVNDLQGILLLDDMQEVDRILSASCLMPDVWQGFITPPTINVDEIYYTKGGLNYAK